MSTNRRIGFRCGILPIMVAMMVIISGFAIGMSEKKESSENEDTEQASLVLELVKISGDDEVLTHTHNLWEVQIIVVNLHEHGLDEILVTTTLPAEIGFLNYTLSQGELQISGHGKGKSGSKSVSWDVGSLEGHEGAALVLTLGPTLNPAGKQEFTSPGEYVIIEGASLKATDVDTSEEISVGPTEPITVVAVDEEPDDPVDPDDPTDPDDPVEPDDPVDPEEPDDPDEPVDPEDDDEEEQKEPVKIDVLFLIDSTGSMGDEIDVVKNKIEDIIFEVQNGTPKPDVRYAIVTYRDRGDAYVTKLFDFTKDVEAIKIFLKSIQARGGGDGPESVNEALHVAINDCSWGDDDHVKMIFLIGDAPPHMDYEDDYDYGEEVKVAQQKEIKIHVIGCSGITSYREGESIFREIAEKTGGTYQKLIYASGSSKSGYHGGSGGSTGSSASSGNHTSYPKFTIPIVDEVHRCISYPEMPTPDVETDDWECCTVCFCCCDSYRGSTASTSAGSSSITKDSNPYSNLLDIQLTYTIQQVAIQNGVTYENVVSIPTT